MNKLARIFFSIYGGFAFMFWIFWAYIAYLLIHLIYKNEKDYSYLLFLYNNIGAAVNKSLLLKVNKHIHYEFNIKESYVVVSNHQTMIDIPANVVGRPDTILFKFLGKKEASKIPFFGHIIENHCILVDRKSEESRQQSYVEMKKQMANGYSIIIYPEGTRNRTNNALAPFYDGAFRLAIELQKPLVVNTLVNIRKLNPPTGFFTYLPGTVDAHWDAPISTKGMTEKDIPRLKEMAKEIMKKRLKNSAF